MPGYHLPLFAAAAGGIFEGNGLKVELVDPFPGPANPRAAALGKYDLCLTSVAHFLRAKAEEPGLPAKFVFMVTKRPHLCVFVRRDGDIHTFRDLEGATVVGSPELPFVREFDTLLRRLGITRGPALEMPYSETIEAFASGKGDVAVDFLDLRPAFEQAGADVRSLPFYEAGGLDVYGSGLVAGTQFISERADALRRVVAAYAEALEATRRDPAPALAAMRKRIPELDEERALRGWEAGQPLIFVDEGMTLEKWRRTIERHAEAHGTPRFDPASVFDASAEPVSAPA
jgi:NitT/TauT family transport system substrate-binding protein